METESFMDRTLGFKERRYIEEIRILTKSTALDCVIDEKFDRIIYVIKAGDMGYAIGKKGDNIRRLQGVTGRKVEMVEYAEDLQEFLSNIFKPAQVIKFACDDQTKKMNIYVSDKNDVGIAIGKGGCTIEKARILIRRFHGYEIGEVFPEESAV
jgi:N utilization substance protein A